MLTCGRAWTPSMRSGSYSVEERHTAERSRETKSLTAGSPEQIDRLGENRVDGGHWQ